MWTIAIVVAVLAVLFSAFATAAVKVSTITRGVVKRWGRRTGRILNEGLNFVLPFGIETVEKIPFGLREIPFEMETITKDQVRVKIKGALQLRPGEGSLLLRFLETTDEMITAGLVSAILAELGAIAGVAKSENFIDKREELSLLIDSLLRLEQPSYLNETDFPGEAPVEPKDRLAFYGKNRAGVRKSLEQAQGSNSKFEFRYGLDIETLTISQVSFSDKVVQAMERKREEEARKKAIDIQVSQAVRGAHKLTEEGGYTQEQAHDIMGPLMGTAEKRRIVDVRGLTGGLPILNLGGLGANPSPSTT